MPPLKESPSQTAGPYVHIGETPNFAEIGGVYETDLGATMLTPETKGQRITITGRITDGAGAPVFDAVVEIWQADADGSHAAALTPQSNSAPAFLGWGRVPVNANGEYRFETIKPGIVLDSDEKPMAPHISLWIVARGINVGLQTRLYFPDEELANAADPVLNRVPEARRPTLTATLTAPSEYRLDIRLQGEDETVFFDI